MRPTLPPAILLIGLVLPPLLLPVGPARAETPPAAAPIVSAPIVSAPPASEPPAATPPAAPVPLSAREAVSQALQCNLGLRVERLAPELSSAPERVARAAVDPVLYSTLSLVGIGDRLGAEGLSRGPQWAASLEAALGMRTRFFSGTELDVQVGGDVGISREGGVDPVTGLGADGGATVSLSLRHPLLRGSDAEVNRAAVTDARLGRGAAELELQRKAEVLGAEVLKAYWDLHAALAQAQTQRVALETARQTLAETHALIEAGRAPASAADSARLLVQTQQRARLLAEQAVENQRDRLARQVGLVGPRSLQTPALVPRETQGLTAPADLPALQRAALTSRGDYLALQRRVRRAAVAREVAADDLRPRLDLVSDLSVGASRAPLMSDPSARETTGRVRWTVGLSFELPVGRRAARARLELATLARRRARLEVARREQQITEALKLAWRQVDAARKRVALSGQALRVARTQLANETARFRAGKTTAQLLVLVHAEVTRERLALQQAEAEHQKALVDVWAAAGSLLAQLRLAPNHAEGAQKLR
jgi:outer membrane protein TolC